MAQPVQPVGNIDPRRATMGWLGEIGYAVSKCLWVRGGYWLCYVKAKTLPRDLVIRIAPDGTYDSPEYDKHSNLYRRKAT